MTHEDLLRLELIKARKRWVKNQLESRRMLLQAQKGCICPPTSEQTCQAALCPRQNPFRQTRQTTMTNDVLAEALNECEPGYPDDVTRLRSALSARNAQVIVWREIGDMSDKYRDGRDVQLYCADTKEQFCANWLISLEDGDEQWVFARKIGPQPIAFIVREPTHFAIIEPPKTEGET